MNIAASAAIDASSDPKPKLRWACSYRLLGCGLSLNIGLRFVVDLSLRIGFGGSNECVVILDGNFKSKRLALRAGYNAVCATQWLQRMG